MLIYVQPILASYEARGCLLNKSSSSGDALIVAKLVRNVLSNEDELTASFCHQVAAYVPDTYAFIK